MPSSAIGTVTLSTLNTTRKTIYKQVFDAHPLGYKLGQKSNQAWEGGGSQMNTNIMAGKNKTVGFRDYKEAISMQEYDPLKQVGIKTAFIDGALVWWDHDEEENVGKFAVNNFVKTMIDGTTDTMKELLALSYYYDNKGYDLAGTGTLADNAGQDLFIAGLPAILDNGTNVAARATYQGLDRSVAANYFWRANAGPTFTDTNNIVRGPFNTSEAFSLNGGTDKGIEHLYNQCSDNGGTDSPDMGLMSLAIYEKFKAILRSELVVNEAMKNAGFQENIQWNNATCFWDNNAPSGSFILLNTKYLSIMPYAGYDKEIQVTPIQNRQVLGEYAKFIMMKWRGNLICNMPRRQGMLENKT